MRTLNSFEQYLLAHTGRFRLLVLLAMLLLVLCHIAGAAEPSHPPMTDAAVLGQSVPPLASFGVMQCGEVVAIWVILQDKSVVRTDAMHHPDTPEEYNAFLRWLQTAQSDIYTIPCDHK